MQKAARPKMMVSVLSALTFTCACYTYLSFVSMSYFGKRNIQQSIFENLKAHDDIGTRLLLLLFLVIFCCNIPFLFFAGKVSIIAIFQTFMEEQTDQDQELDYEFMRNPDNF